MASKEITQLRRRAEKQGWVIDFLPSGHLLWHSPGGAEVRTSCTPKDPRSVRNAKHDLKKAGLR